MSQRDIATVPETDAETAATLPSRLGRFEIVRRLGAGGMGVVFEGRDALLGRRVALKLLHPSRPGGQLAPARLLREAQALARLTHPNVVTVFEVGLAGENPFIAMELVQGVTLHEWMREPREWRAVLDIFISVGRGLAAVHELGLVHRDFKPSNVLVDARGVPKLGDFGLVGVSDEFEEEERKVREQVKKQREQVRTLRNGQEQEPREAVGEQETMEAPSGSAGSGGEKLTETGGVMGTPAYMAPEQAAGIPVDARADQYSFAKTLREALRDPLPPALETVLARALSLDPNDRFATMEPLLDELERIRRGNRRRWIALGATTAVVAAVAVAWGFGRAQATTDAPCPRPTERVGAVWGTTRRAALEAHLGAIDTLFGRQRFAAAATVFDRGAARWMDLHVDACQLSHEGRQSDALLDRRMACLDRSLFEIDETVGLIERASNPTTLDEAMRAVVGLPTLDECADVAALTEKLPRPTNPLQRTEADSIEREAVDIDVALRTGGTRTGVIERARAAVARARLLAYPETLARSLGSLAAIQLEDEDGAAAIETLREAITAASAAHDDRAVAELWSKLLIAFVQQKRASEANTLVPAAEAALARITAPIEMKVRLLDSRAQVASASGDVPHAQQLLAEAMKLLDQGGAAAPQSPLVPLLLAIRRRTAATYAAADEWPRMVDEYRAIIPLTNAQFGPDHPVVLQSHFNLGVALRHVRDNEAALVEFREAARIGEARLAPSPNLAGLIDAVGTTLILLRRFDEAQAYLEKSLAMARATMPAGDVRLAGQIGNLGSVLIAARRYDEAQRAFEEQLAIYEKNGLASQVNTANVLFNIANTHYLKKHCENAWAPLERALTIYQTINEKDHYDIDGTFNLLSQCQYQTKQWAPALRTADRLLGTVGIDPTFHAAARFTHARARAATGDVAGGQVEAREARAEMLKLAGAEEAIAEVDAWLARL
ncbi:MAG: serine/threonine protein kinase [Myxococcales bacterium]|nr:serine/threonine protein kinase [Myxococcales bacterium]